MPYKAKHSAPIALHLLALGLSVSLAHANELTDNISQALNNSDVAVNLRYRYENVDQDGIKNTANASTLRSRISLTSGKVGNFQGFIEVDNVAYIGDDKFNTTTNGKTQYPVVADPDYTEVNQAFIRYAFDHKNTVTFGQQRINHDRQRFLGGVGWRQNEQTYEAVRVQTTPLKNLQLDYSYIWEIDRIFDPDNKKSKFTGNTHALHGSYKIADHHKVTAYSYILDFDQAPALSSKTYGVEYKGAVPLSDSSSLGIQLAAAKQKQHANNTANYSANYYLGEVTTQFKPLSVSLGHEVLGSDNGTSFKTPLATLHKFQGFADKFLNTPAKGIKDSYVKVAGKAGAVKLTAFYHDFKAEKGNANYGSELDLVASYKISKHYSMLLKYAAYNADDFASDTDKVVAMFTAKF